MTLLKSLMGFSRMSQVELARHTKIPQCRLIVIVCWGKPSKTESRKLEDFFGMPSYCLVNIEGEQDAKQKIISKAIVSRSLPGLGPYCTGNTVSLRCEPAPVFTGVLVAISHNACI
jgi:hypothetical protein